jgi:HAD superfamily hydrolase (TIGR01450 family)
MSVDLTPYQAVLLDLDGTVYHEDHALPGAVEFIQRLQREGRTFACISNGTISPLRVMERLMRMGLEVDPNNIYTAAAAACDYVVQHFPRGAAAGADNANPRPQPRVYNLATESVEEMLSGLVTWVESAREECDAVVVGAPSNTFALPEERQRTALYLIKRGAAIVGICADRVYPSPRGLELGAGALSWMLGYAAGVEPTFCGKPQPIFFQELCQRLNVDPRWCLLIGDNLESDVLGGKSQGMRTILALSGITRQADLAALPPEQQPDLVVQSLADLL